MHCKIFSAFPSLTINIFNGYLFERFFARLNSHIGIILFIFVWWWGKVIFPWVKKLVVIDNLFHLVCKVKLNLLFGLHSIPSAWQLFHDFNFLSRLYFLSAFALYFFVWLYWLLSIVNTFLFLICKSNFIAPIFFIS